MEYVIETLNIEKYKLVGVKRQLFLYQQEGQTSFREDINEICDKFKQIDWAIAELRKDQPE